MRHVSSRRPSASMVVALLALIIALGGSAYAATKIGTKDIRKGAVTAGKIRAGAVTAKKIRPGAVGTERLADDAVTGEKVLESSLGPVPWARQANLAGLADRADLAQTAASAKSAEHATTADTARTATGFSRYHTTGLVRASVGETVPLATIGPFTIAGACIDVEAPTVVRARTLISTSQPNSFLSSLNANYVGGGFQPGVVAELGNDIADDEPEWFALNAESMWTAASPDGSVLLQGFANNGVFVFGRDCAFNLTWMENG